MRWLFLIIGMMIFPGMVHAQDKKPPAKITYDDHILPFFCDKCLSCHNQDKKSGGLMLHNYTALMEGSSAGKIVEPGNADGSSLFLVLNHQREPFMPPKAPKLPPENLDLIKQWIAGGVLENAGSKSLVTNKPKVELKVSANAIGKPSGPPPMPGKLPLEPVVRTPKANAVTAMASNPWSPLIAVGGQKQVLLYHSDTLELLGVLPFPEGVPHVLKFSRNGSLLLAGGGRGAKAGRVVVWSVATGERVFQVGEEYDAVLAADISADQSQIALGGPSKIIRIYSTKDGQLLHEIKKHTDWLYSMEYSPDGVLLATADRNGGVFVWEVSTGKEYLALRGHTAAVTEVTWRADSNVLATGSEDTTVRLWEMENGGQIKSWGAHPAGVQSVCFAKDGRLISTGRDRVTKLWDQNGAQQRAFEALPDVGLRVIFNHDATRVIAGDWTGQVRVWTTADAKHLGNLLANPPTVAEQVEIAKRQTADAKVKYDQFAGVAVNSQKLAEQAAKELADAQKVLSDLSTTAKTASDNIAKSKDELGKLNAAITTAQTQVPVKDAATKLLAEAAAKVKEAAEKLKDNKELADFALKSQELATKSMTELVQLQKSITDMGTAVKTATDQIANLQKIVEKATADMGATQKLIEARTAAAKAAADKAVTDKAATEQAAAALKLAETSVAKWTAAK